MKPTILILILIGCCPTVLGQTGKLTGFVLDAEVNAPLELATVSIFDQDSSLVSYQLSDKHGKFAFEKLPVNKKLLVSITYTGYSNHETTIRLESGKTDSLSAYLLRRINDSSAVVVTASVPVRMNGDTLEINPAAFKMKSEAVVEELLNQVPGITIWSDGTITVNGRKVQNIFVDGKPFLGSTDPRVATQNLPKAAIEKIQLYQEYDRSNIGRESQPQDSLLTMNIKLKEDSKKGYFGKAGAGYGTTGRFESDLSFQVYNKKSSAGIGGGFNNINKNIGSLQEMFQENTYRNSNPNLYSVGRFGANGVNRNYSIGGIFSHNLIETTNSRQNNRIGVNFNASGADTYLTDLNLQTRTTIDHPQLIRDEGMQNNRNDRQDLGLTYVRTNSYNDNLEVHGSVALSDERGHSARYTEVRDRANQLQSRNHMNTAQHRKSDNESLGLGFAKFDIENLLKSFHLQLNAQRSTVASQRDVWSSFQSLTDNRNDASFSRRYTSSNHSFSTRGTLNYAGFKRLLFGRFNLFGIDLNLTQWFNYTRSSDNIMVSDYDSTGKKYTANNNLSNFNQREIMEYTPTLRLNKSFAKWTGTSSRFLFAHVVLTDEIKTEKNQSSFAKRNLNRSFQFFGYEGLLSYNYTKNEKHMYQTSISYAKKVEYPSIDQLHTIVDDINAYDIRMGNPNLQNRINHRLNINTGFNTVNPKSVYTLISSISGGYTRSVNPVTDSLVNEPSGKRVSYYTNADESNDLNLNYSLNLSRRLKKDQIQLMYRGYFNSGKHPNYIDGLYTVSESGNVSNEVTVQYSLRSLLLVNLSKARQYFETRQTAAGLTAFKNANNSTKLGLTLNYPENFTVSSTLDHIDNANLDKPTILWNAFASYRFMKQQGELKFSAMDLLKQYQNITNGVNPYGTTTRITNGLQQYFLLTFSYYPRKFGKTGIKNQPAQDNVY